MKITFGMKGVAPAPADYGMLRAALVAAQAATPTARASSTPTELPADPYAVLHSLFAAESTHPTNIETLGHSFRRGASGRDRNHDQ